MAMYSFSITNNGREVDDLNAGVFNTEREAMEAGEEMLGDLCPAHSPSRKHYRVESLRVTRPWERISDEGAEVLAKLIRERNPEALPTDDRELLEACDHNLIGSYYIEAERAAGGSVADLASLRAQLGLPVIV
jgi:hypothetical protein